MNEDLHISDQELQQVVSENQTLADQQAIETHISNCNHCQARLLEIAADANWRSEFVKSLPEDFASEISMATSSDVAADSVKASQTDDDFDLETVDKMLEEILLPPTHPETLGRLERYEIESVIGCGGMGVVLRGYDRELQRPVAIKMILPRLSRNGTAKQRFAREARAAAAILHPNVIAIHGIDETGGVPWFVMPLIVGPSLKDLIKEHGPLPECEIVRISLQIASGLAAAHSQGLVHRDIKPENILIDNRVNRVVITDFGLARRESEQSMTQTGCLAGTLNYMSPEQAQGKYVDSRSDLFSLGSLIYFLATGEVPFVSNSPMGALSKVINEQHADVRTRNPEMSQTLAQVIDRLLQKDPQDRFQSAAELESILEQFISHLHQPTIQQLPVIPQPVKKRAHQRHRISSFVIASLVLVVLALSSWIFVNWKSTQPEVAPEILWAEIQQNHQIRDADEFQWELIELERKINSFDLKLQTGQNNETNIFNEQIGEVNQQLERLERALK